MLARLALASAVCVAGCAGDGAAHTAPMTVALTVDSGGADGDGTVTDTGSISSEPDDQWGAFLDRARDAIGADPSDITLDEASLALEPSSIGVTDLAEVFHGPVSVELRMDTSGARRDVAEGLLNDDAIGAEAPLSPRFRLADFAGDDLADLLAGAFDVVFVGQAGSEFRSGNATAELRLTLVFSAFE